MITIVLLCVLCCCINVLVMYMNGLSPTDMLFVGVNIFENTDQAELETKLYMAPWTRFGPYLVGIWLGYKLAHWDNHCNNQTKQAAINGSTPKTPSSAAPASSAKTRRLSVGAQAVGWLMSLVFGFGSLFGLWPALHGYDWMLYHYMYCGTHRLLWALAIAWLLYACHTGHAYWLNRCLSAGWMVPLANLSLGTYLFHLPGVVGANIMLGFFRSWTGHFSHSWLIVFNVIISYIAGGLKTALLVELPAANLERLFLTNRTTSSNPVLTKQQHSQKTDTKLIMSNAAKETAVMLCNGECGEIDDNNNNKDDDNNIQRK